MSPLLAFFREISESEGHNWKKIESALKKEAAKR